MTFAPVAPMVEYVILVIGELLQTLWFSVAGSDVRFTVLNGVTVTFTFADAVHPAGLVTARLYTPFMAGVALRDTFGFCDAEMYPFGPVQEYKDIPAGPPKRFSGVPWHTGLLLEADATRTPGSIILTGTSTVHIIASRIVTI